MSAGASSWQRVLRPATMLGVPGEDLPHVSHWMTEAHATSGLDVVIIGGKNSAVEAALQCYRAGARVTIVYRRDDWRPSVKYWLRPDLENRVREGSITAMLGSTVERITPAAVEVRDGAGGVRAVAADRAVALTGYHPDISLLESIGFTSGRQWRPTLDAETLETTCPGFSLVGARSGKQISGSSSRTGVRREKFSAMRGREDARASTPSSRGAWASERETRD